MRVAGIGLLSLVPILIGLYRKEKLLQQGRIRASILRLFETITFEIDAFTRGQDQIFLQFRDRELERMGFLPHLRNEIETVPCGAFQRSLPLLFQTVSFSEREQNGLLEFGEYFGLQSKESQLRDCNKILSLLRSEEERMGAKRKADASVAQTTGLCIGIGMFILLI
ncbi:MAG: hypothetical protein IKD18_02685 [Clostridia bacterium]|nr:hypothetical protein [Clostridia bacterium]